MFLFCFWFVFPSNNDFANDKNKWCVNVRLSVWDQQVILAANRVSIRGACYGPAVSDPTPYEKRKKNSALLRALVSDKEPTETGVGRSDRAARRQCRALLTISSDGGEGV